MLLRAHSGHEGMEGCLRRLRESLFWPGMTVEAKVYMDLCDVCKTVQDMPSKEPMCAHDYPMRSWAKVATDICYLNGRIVTDYFSNFFRSRQNPKYF